MFSNSIYAVRRGISISTTLDVSLFTGCESRIGGIKPSQGQKGNQPPLSFLVPSQKEFDLGIVPKNENRKIEFWITNPGKKEIRLEGVKTSCDCFSIDLEKRAIAPNEKVEAMAVIDSRHDVRSPAHCDWMPQASSPGPGQQRLIFM
jgi:hypothetical protein